MKYISTDELNYLLYDWSSDIQSVDGDDAFPKISSRRCSWRIFLLWIVTSVTVIYRFSQFAQGVDRPSQRWPSFVLQVAVLGSGNDPDHDCASRNQAVDNGLKLPLAWVHFPKCGTNFLNSMFHDACCADTWSYWYGEKSNQGKWLIRDLEYSCYGGWSTGRDGFKSFSNHHEGYGPYVERFWGNAVAIFRKPEQRMLSGWFHKSVLGIPHSYLKRGTWYSEAMWYWFMGYQPPTLEMYRERVAGCYTKTLTRGGENSCGLMPQPTALEASLALKYIDGFQFVGLREEWELSVCLWHAKFGGQCHFFEFENYHTRHEHPTFYDVKLLEGWTDPWDGPIFEKVRKRFYLELSHFNVTRARCRNEICPTRISRK